MPRDGYLCSPDYATNVSQDIIGKKGNKHEG